MSETAERAEERGRLGESEEGGKFWEGVV